MGLIAPVPPSDLDKARDFRGVDDWVLAHLKVLGRFAGRGHKFGRVIHPTAQAIKDWKKEGIEGRYRGHRGHRQTGDERNEALEGGKRVAVALCTSREVLC